MKSFSVEIPTEDKELEEFQSAMDEYHNELNIYIENLADQLKIPVDAALDVFYLRTRSRWTQEKEDYLIRLAREGKPFPNINENFEVPRE